MLCYDAEFPRRLRRDPDAEQTEHDRRRGLAPRDAASPVRHRQAAHPTLSLLRLRRGEAALASSP
jgi:hypothetical protein